MNDSPLTLFVLNIEGQVVYSYNVSHDLEEVIQIGKRMLDAREEAQYAYIVERVVEKQGRVVTFDVGHKWLGVKECAAL